MADKSFLFFILSWCYGCNMFVKKGVENGWEKEGKSVKGSCEKWGSDNNKKTVCLFNFLS